MAAARASSSLIAPLRARAWKWPARLTAVSTRPRVAVSFSASRVRRSAASSSAISTSTASTPSRVNRVSLREIPMRDRRSDMVLPLWVGCWETYRPHGGKVLLPGAGLQRGDGRRRPHARAGRSSELLPVAPGLGDGDRGLATAVRCLLRACGSRLVCGQLDHARRGLCGNRRLVLCTLRAFVPHPEDRDRLHQLPGLLFHAARGRRGFLDQGRVLLRALV